MRDNGPVETDTALTKSLFSSMFIVLSFSCVPVGDVTLSECVSLSSVEVVSVVLVVDT